MDQDPSQVSVRPFGLNERIERLQIERPKGGFELGPRHLLAESIDAEVPPEAAQSVPVVNALPDEVDGENGRIVLPKPVEMAIAAPCDFSDDPFHSVVKVAFEVQLPDETVTSEPVAKLALEIKT